MSEGTTRSGSVEAGVLLSKARAGDALAFQRLTESHRRELQAHCYRMLGCLQDAEDTLQETLLAAWQGLETFQANASSSGQGSVANNETGGYEVYRASKAALNTLMRSFAARHKDDARTLLLLAPGWVRTDMGGPGARLSVEESIPNLVKTVLAQEGRAGLQYLDYLGRTVPW